MQKQLLACVLALTAAGTAVAGDSWQGGYVGLSVGQSNADSSQAATLGSNWTSEPAALQTLVTDSLSRSYDADGDSFGIQAGYDWSVGGGKAIFGLVLDYNDFSAKQIDTTSAASGSLSYTIVQGLEVMDSFSLRARLGYGGERVMPYISAGYATTDFDVATGLASNGGYAKAGGKSESLSGAVWGAGIEFKFNDNWSGQLEYLDYGDGDVSYVLDYLPGSTFPGYSETISQEIGLDTIRFSLNYRF